MRTLKLIGLGAAIVIIVLWLVTELKHIEGQIGFVVLRALSQDSQRSQLSAQACTVTIQPGQSIQQAIDQVSPGAVICLEEGVFEVLEGHFFDLKITKAPLTLRGAGPRKTILKNAVLRIQGLSRPLEDIVIEGLAILASDTPGQIPFLVEISSAEVTAKSVRIGTDALTAIEPRRAAGILLDSKSILRVEESRLFGLHVAIFSDAGKIEIQRSLVYGSECGVVLAGGPQEEFVLFNEVRLTANGIGLIAAKGVRMRMQRSVVELQNLGFVGCGFLETGSSLPVGAAGEGILLQGQSVLVAVESRIANNHSYGVAAYLKRCGFQEDSFTGRVELINTAVQDNEQGNVCLP